MPLDISFSNLASYAVVLNGGIIYIIDKQEKYTFIDDLNCISGDITYKVPKEGCLNIFRHDNKYYI